MDRISTAAIKLTKESVDGNKLNFCQSHLRRVSKQMILFAIALFIAYPVFAQDDEFEEQPLVERPGQQSKAAEEKKTEQELMHNTPLRPLKGLML